MQKRRAAGVLAVMTTAVSLLGHAGAQASAVTPEPRSSRTATPQPQSSRTSTPKPRSSRTAGPLDTSCALTLACFWSNVGRGGDKGEVEGNNSNYLDLKNAWGCTHFPGTWNDCIMSAANAGLSCTVYFWTGAGYKGSYHSLGIGDSTDTWANPPFNDPSFNNAISSNHWCSPKP